MNLVDHIKQHALSSAQAGDFATVAATLNALTTEVRDSTLRSARWLMLNLTDVVTVTNGIPITEADIVLGTLQSPDLPPRVKAAYQSLCNGGLDLSEAQVQQMIPLLAQAGSWPSGLAEKVLAAGRQTVSVLESPTTALLCRQAWKESERRMILDEMQTRWDAIKNLIGTADNADAVSGLLAMADVANALEV